MHHAGAVRLIQRIRDLHSILQRLLERQRPFFQFLRQGLAFDALHHQKLHAFLLSNIVQHANVRMIQAGDGLGLALKTLSENGIFGEMRRKNFDGDGAVQARIACAVNFAHASRAERRQDFVWAEASARGQCHNGVDYIPLNQALEITLVFATEGRIPPLKRLFIKEGGVAVATA